MRSCAFTLRKVRCCHWTVFHLAWLLLLSGLATYARADDPTFTAHQKGVGKVQDDSNSDLKAPANQGDTVVITPSPDPGDYSYLLSNPLAGKDWQIDVTVTLEVQGEVKPVGDKDPYLPICELSYDKPFPQEWDSFTRSSQGVVYIDWKKSNGGHLKPGVRSNDKRKPQLDLPLDHDLTFRLQVRRQGDKITITKDNQPLYTVDDVRDEEYIVFGLPTWSQGKHIPRNVALHIKLDEIQGSTATSANREDGGGGRTGTDTSRHENGNLGGHETTTVTSVPTWLVLMTVALALLVVGLIVVVSLFSMKLNRLVISQKDLEGRVTAKSEKQLFDLTRRVTKMETDQMIDGKELKIWAPETIKRIKVSEEDLKRLQVRLPAGDSGSGNKGAQASASSSPAPWTDQQLASKIANFLKDWNFRKQAFDPEVNRRIDGLRSHVGNLQQEIITLKRLSQAPSGSQNHGMQQGSTIGTSAPRPGSNASYSPQTGAPAGRAQPPLPSAPRTLLETLQALSWDKRWEALRGALVDKVVDASLKEDIDRLDFFCSVLVTEWNKRRTPLENPEAWKEELWLNRLDSALYEVPQNMLRVDMDALFQERPETRELIDLLCRTIQEAQSQRKADLKAWSMERIEGIPGRGPIANLLEYDETMFDPTEDEVKDDTYSRIIPGRAGYRLKGQVLRPTHAVFFRHESPTS